MSRRRLHELVHGQRAMSTDTAIRCAHQFGIDAGFWLAQQAAWDSFRAWKRLSLPTQPLR
jgi:addiction module HigA family antidote